MKRCSLCTENLSCQTCLFRFQEVREECPSIVDKEELKEFLKNFISSAQTIYNNIGQENK